MANGAIGTVLKRLREEQGLSQEQLGFKAELHRTFVSQLERGLKSPSLKTLDRLAAVLGLKTSRVVALAEDEEA
jgi:transcriptional regulator with XRE-family HTH domain